MTRKKFVDCSSQVNSSRSLFFPLPRNCSSTVFYVLLKINDNQLKFIVFVDGVLINDSWRKFSSSFIWKELSILLRRWCQQQQKKRPKLDKYLFSCNFIPRNIINYRDMQRDNKVTEIYYSRGHLPHSTFILIKIWSSKSKSRMRKSFYVYTKIQIDYHHMGEWGS